MPKKKPEPQSGADESVLRAINIAVRDFKQFVRFQAQLEGFDDVPQIHLDAADFLQGWHPHQVGKKKKIMGFRLAAKTTVLNRWYICWRWLRCAHLQVIIHSSTNEIAKDIGRSFLNILQTNPLLKHLAPPLGTAETQFNLNGITHEQGYSLRTAGISTSLTGSRCDIYEFDDPEPNVEPESMRTRILQAFGEANHILHRPDRHMHRMRGNGVPLVELQPPEITQLIVLGQPHCIGSAYFPNEDEINNDEGHPLDGALEHRIDALDKTETEWSWPFIMERKHYNYLAQRPMTIEEVQKTEYTKLDWLLQMRIQPENVALLGAVLKLQFIERVHRFVDNPVMTVDPADGGKCETAIAIGGLFGNQIHLSYVGGYLGETYEGDNVDGTLGESIWRRIFDMADEFHVGLILIEKNYKAAIAACRRYMSKSGRVGEVREFASTGQKLRRICKGLEQPINNGMMTAEPGVLEDGKTSAQFRGLRYDRLPEPCDRIDAVEMLVSHLLENRATHSGGIIRMIPQTVQIPQFGRVGGGGNPFSRIRR